MFSLRRQLQSTICRWLFDQYLDESQSWYDCHSIKTQTATTMEDSDDERTDDIQPPVDIDSWIDRTNQELEVRTAPSPTESAATPSPKRIKMAHVTADTTPTKDADSPVQCQCQWPLNEIPVEIFEIITSYLPRAEIKTLRQVCREFDRKASARYFKNVVVPFRSELYGRLDRDENGDIQQHPVSLLSNAGNRIFESFGPYILRFALSLEIDEDALAHPPLKSTQEAVPSFWGIYRWPHRTYNRYADLESIEQTADETQGMKDVLRCLTKVRNLGLCCDAGLGFLIRPDSVARSNVVKQPVFATHDWRRETRPYAGTREDETIITVADFNGRNRPRRKDSTDSIGYKQSVLEKMAAEAGYEGAQVQEAINLLLETEGQAVDQITFDGRSNSNETITDSSRNDNEAGGAWPLFLDSHLRRRGQSADSRSHSPRRAPALIPNNLSKAQRELILELEWAHRAMIQSFVIATVDNASAGCFNNLTTLTIAKIPSSHVYILYNEDFWDSLTQLNTVSLGVIADWRKITKTLPGYIDDQQISPVQAVSKVHTLLNDYIGKYENIESLHFEWICGGEFAPSFAQRNRYIIPAPFLGKSGMASPVSNFSDDLLELPFVKHFSLKNCWATPHVLWQMVRQMGLARLEKLQLESVSLSARYTTEPQMPLAQGQHGAHATFMPHQQNQQHQANLLFGAYTAPNPPPPINGYGSWYTLGAQQPPGPHVAQASAHQTFGQPTMHVTQTLQPGPPNAFIAPLGMVQPAPPPPPPEDPSATTSIFSVPEWHSWSGFLEQFSPGPNVRRMRASNPSFHRDSSADDNPWEAELANAHRFVPHAQNLLAEEQRYSIKSIILKSCGRVSIDDSHIATRSISRASAVTGGHPVLDAQSSVQRHMQQDWDPMLGRVLPTIDPQESRTLTDVFGLVHGWYGVYSEKIIANARADGITSPGLGRFSGILEEHGTRTNFRDDFSWTEPDEAVVSSAPMALPFLPADESEDTNDDWGDYAAVS